MTSEQIVSILGQAFGIFLFAGVVSGLFFIAAEFILGMLINIAMMFYIPYLVIRKTFELTYYLITRGKRGSAYGK